MTDPIAAFCEHMAAQECAPDASETIVANDRMQRYRLAGDKPTVKNGSYILRVDPDGFAVGGFQSFRQHIWHKWHTKAARKATDAERAEWKRRAEDARLKQEEDRKKAAYDAAAKAASIWGEAERTGTNAYLDKKRLKLSDIGCRMSRGKVLVPMWSNNKLVGLQFIDDDGDKLFLKGAMKEGAYHAIKGDGDLLVIGEGLATMAAIHASLGCSVIVAFDAGNLKPVAVDMRAKYPDKRIIIAADGDQWTIKGKKPDGWDNPPGDDPRWMEWRESGLCVNTGAEKAAQAAVAIGGAVVVSPPIPETDATKRTDWWDYWADGGDVRSAFDHAMTPPPYDERLDREYDPDDVHYDYADPVVDHDDGDIFSTNPVLRAVRPLGRSDKTFYFFPRACGQIIDFSGPALANMQNLITMAPNSLWETNFDTGSDRKRANLAANMLIEACNMIGIYSPETQRGIGVWMDGETQVFNSGARLYFPDRTCHPTEHKSDNVYVMGPCVGSVSGDQMSNADAGELLKICLALSWKGKHSGYMLAGWIVTAMIGGALRWRSHVTITGEKGSGKSWVLDEIIRPLLGRLAVSLDGGTTEARLRRDLGGTARPLIMDESESESKRDRLNMEQVYMLARKSSSGARIANANGDYVMRSSFAFAAINPRIVQGADLDRNTMLQLVVNRDHSAAEDFKELKRRVMRAVTEASAKSLLARCFHNLPTILRNIETFSDVLAEQEGSKRFGDQYGTLVAGAYSLTSTKEISAEQAAEWCARHDWSWARVDNEQSDPERLLEYILSSRIRHDDRGMMRESSVARLMDRAIHADGQDRDVAAAALGDNGIKVDADWFYVASPCKPVAHMLRDTAWSGSYRRALSELAGSVSHDKMTFSPAMRLRSIAIPMAMVTGDTGDSYEEELPFGVDDFR